MDGLVARLHNRYRMIGSRGPAGALAARLDRLAGGALPGVLDEALDQALGDDPAVYVIRGLEARLVLDVGPGSTDAGLARAWSRKLARAVVDAVAAGPDGENVVRFESQADYVAHFLAALLRGRP